MKIFVWAYLVLGAISAAAQQPLETMLQLKPGNYWIYEGTAEWGAVDSGAKADRQKVRWKTEIEEESIHGDLKAYLVRGSPFELAWYGPTTKPEQHIWIVYQNRFYALSATPDMLQRFHNSADPLTDLVENVDPVLQLPLRLGKCTEILKPDEPRERTDLRYCWYLENKTIRLLHIAGLPRSAIVWRASSFTNPDDEHIGFAPDIGIVSYNYSHHGTVSEAHLKLVEAHLQ